jgi:hypothetical protein
MSNWYGIVVKDKDSAWSALIFKSARDAAIRADALRWK